MWNFRSKLSFSWLSSFFRRDESVSKLKGLEFAFNCGGKAFYKWQTVEAMPILRLMAAKDYLDMLEIGAEREDITAYLEVVKEAIKHDKIDKYKLSIITEQLSNRLNMATNTGLLYNLAAVYYVSEEEELETAKAELIEAKAEFFKESMPIEDFFLNSRLRDYLPAGNTSDMNLQSFSRGEQAEAKERRTSLLLYLSSLTDKETPTSLYLKQVLAKQKK